MVARKKASAATKARVSHLAAGLRQEARGDALLKSLNKQNFPAAKRAGYLQAKGTIKQLSATYGPVSDLPGSKRKKKKK